MIIKTSGNLILEVTKERADIVKQALLSGVEYIEIDDILLKASTIMSVEKSPPLRYLSNNKPLCLPTSTLSNEQLTKNIKRIKLMKQKFLSSL